MSTRRNGFIDPIKDAMSTPVSADPRVEKKLAVNLKERSPVELREAVSQRVLAEQVLDIKGTYCPSPDDMVYAHEIFPEGYSTGACDDIVTRHVEEMQRLFDIQAGDYLTEAIDGYLSRDDGIDLPEVERFYHSISDSTSPNRIEAANTFSTHKYAYLQTLLPTMRQGSVYRPSQSPKSPLLVRVRQTQFPASLVEYREMEDVSVRWCIAVFLVGGGDEDTKEKARSLYRWTEQQVKPLEDLYATDSAFKAEVQRDAVDLNPKAPTPFGIVNIAPPRQTS
ncbi:hypothetical protein BC835DRAFT_1529186 [Cytidiella melzeri]|nr:hypothetical protein BC835DRAFT_1529186 [Cytidiella melzeri]